MLPARRVTKALVVGEYVGHDKGDTLVVDTIWAENEDVRSNNTARLTPTSSTSSSRFG